MDLNSIGINGYANIGGTINIGFGTTDIININGNFTLSDLCTAYINTDLKLHFDKCVDVSGCTTGGIKTSSGILTNTKLGYLTNITSDVNNSFNTINTALNTINTNLTAISYSGGTTNITSKIYFNGATSQTLPSTTSSNTGTGLFWNISGGSGETDYLNYAQGGSGGHSFYSINATTTPHLLVSIDSVGTIKPSGSVDITTGTGILTTAGLISNTVTGYLYGVSSSIQTQFNNIVSSVSGLLQKTTSQTYNSSSNTTSFSGNLATTNLSCNGVSLGVGNAVGVMLYNLNCQLVDIPCGIADLGIFGNYQLDDGWVLYPGYSCQLFINRYFGTGGGYSNVLSNTGTVPLLFNNSISVAQPIYVFGTTFLYPNNATGSVKIWYNGALVYIAGWS